MSRTVPFSISSASAGATSPLNWLPGNSITMYSTGVVMDRDSRARRDPLRRPSRLAIPAAAQPNHQPIASGAMSILGHRVLRREDPALLTTGGTYVDDIDLPDAAFVTYVRATMAHARLVSVDVDEARTMPGVLAVVTAADLDLADLGALMPMFNAAMTRPLLARDTVALRG